MECEEMVMKARHCVSILEWRDGDPRVEEPLEHLDHLWVPVLHEHWIRRRLQLEVQRLVVVRGKGGDAAD